MIRASDCLPQHWEIYYRRKASKLPVFSFHYSVYTIYLLDIAFSALKLFPNCRSHNQMSDLHYLKTWNWRERQVKYAFRSSAIHQLYFLPVPVTRGFVFTSESCRSDILREEKPWNFKTIFHDKDKWNSGHLLQLSWTGMSISRNIQRLDHPDKCESRQQHTWVGWRRM